MKRIWTTSALALTLAACSPSPTSAPSGQQSSADRLAQKVMVMDHPGYMPASRLAAAKEVAASHTDAQVRERAAGLIAEMSSPDAPVPTPREPDDTQKAKTAALERFVGLPAIRHVEWLDDDFIIAALDNGKSWQPVAESACAWIRNAGHRARFSVVILEAGALQNRNWTQLARARCN